jgi:hypothetical protein
MSHFVTFVIGPDPEAQLAPFSEEIEVEPYKSRETAPYWWLDRDEDGNKPDMTPAEALADYNARGYNDGEEKVYLDDEGLYTWTTYNPLSKWDWYTLGGRWTGAFKLKPGRTGQVGRPGTMGEPGEAGWVDAALKGDIDFDGMRNEALREAREKWTLFLAGKGDDELPPMPASEYDGPNNPEAVQAWREEWRTYNLHPVIRRISDHLVGEGGHYWGEIGEDFFQGDVFAYEANAIDRAVSCFSALINGEWFEPGKMGWFGMTSATKDDRKEFRSWLTKTIDALDDDVLISSYDLHI